MLRTGALQILKFEQAKWQIRAIDTDPLLRSIEANVQLRVAAMFGAAALAATPILSKGGSDGSPSD